MTMICQQEIVVVVYFDRATSVIVMKMMLRGYHHHAVADSMSSVCVAEEYGILRKRSHAVSVQATIDCRKGLLRFSVVVVVAGSSWLNAIFFDGSFERPNI
jgi:hypothetical protein